MFPVGLCLILGIGGLILWRRKTLSRVLLIFSMALLLILSIPYVSLHLVKTIENRAGDYADIEDLRSRGVKYVVVLSGDYRMGDLTAADHLNSSNIRLLEGIRLWKETPGSKLVMTGGAIPGLSGDEIIAEEMAGVAMMLGVPEESIILEDKSWTTEDQARACVKIVGDAPFVLVTSAFHLPRSVMMFKQEGLDPIRAPCDFITRTIPLNYGSLMPQAGGLSLSELFLKETIATYYYKFKASLP
jgi:uncharacterized SAM-binding protein YcdF (DUF218 family)